MTDFRVRMPDGVEIAFPDGTPLETMQSVARQYHAQHAAPTQPAPEPSLGGDAAGILSGFNRGVASALGAPVDLATGATNLVTRGINAVTGAEIGQIEDPIGGSQSIRRGMTAIGIDTERQPQTGAGRIAARAAQEIGGYMPFLGAARGIQGLANAGRIALGPRAAAVTNALASQPGIQATISTGAGVGAGLANEIVPGDPWADLGGALIGAIGTGGGIAVGSAAARAVAPFVSPGARQMAAGYAMRRFSSDPEHLVERLAQAPREAVPGSPLTTAQALAPDDPGMAILERTVRSEDPSRAAAFSVRDRAQSQADLAALQDIGPIPPGTDAAASVQGLIQGAFDQAQQTAAARVGALGREVTPEQAGRIIREEFNAALGAMRGRVRTAFESIDPDGTTAIPGAAIYVRAAEPVNRIFGPGSGGPPRELTDILSDLRGEAMPLQTLQNIRSRALTLARQARSGQNPDARVASVADSIADAIRSGIDDAATRGAGMTPEQAALWQQARVLRVEQAERFERGAAAAVSRTESRGGPALGNSEVPGAFFNNGRGAVEDMQQFDAALGASAPARDARRDYIVSNMLQAVRRENGTFDAAAWRRWMTSHADALRQYPELMAQMRTARSAALVADNLSRQGSRFLAPDANPESAVRAALSGQTRRRDLAALTRLAGGNEEQLAAIRRAVIDDLVARSGIASSSSGTTRRPQELLSLVRAWRPDLQGSGLFGREHLQALDAVVDDIRRQMFARDAGRAIGSPTYQNFSSGALLAQVGLGIIGPENTLANTLLRPLSWLYRIPDQQIRNLLFDAMADPDVAQALAGRATPERMQWLSNMLRRRAIATGITVPEQGPPQQDERPQ